MSFLFSMVLFFYITVSLCMAVLILASEDGESISNSSPISPVRWTQKNSFVNYLISFLGFLFILNCIVLNRMRRYNLVNDIVLQSKLEKGSFPKEIASTFDEKPDLEDKLDKDKVELQIKSDLPKSDDQKAESSSNIKKEDSSMDNIIRTGSLKANFVPEDVKSKTKKSGFYSKLKNLYSKYKNKEAEDKQEDESYKISDFRDVKIDSNKKLKENILTEDLTKKKNPLDNDIISGFEQAILGEFDADKKQDNNDIKKPDLLNVINKYKNNFGDYS